MDCDRVSDESSMKDRPTAVDLFAGAGGMSLGFEQAGFDMLAAVELDPIHAAVHHFNFPKTATVARSVVGLDAGEVLARVAECTGRDEIDVVCGGAPCQGFSLIGKRVFDDPRNDLVRQYVRLVVELGAKYFVFENVKGLTVGRHAEFLRMLVAEFGRNGYQVRQPWRVLNARNYGVPQNRERLFILGARAGLPLPDYPPARTEDTPDLFSPKGVRPVPTCWDALSDLPDNERFDELLACDSVRVPDWLPEGDFAREMHCLGDCGWHDGHRRQWDPLLLTASMRTDHTEISRRRFAATAQGEVEPVSRFYRLSASGQCNTLRAGTDSARGAFTSPRPIHYRYPRCVSVREMARLHGYPDWFRFHVTKWHGARQIGNSVPPPLARAVASAVMAAMGLVPMRPEGVLDLGSPALLALDMTEAAAYWGVEVPIGKRDRKSGARKRKQAEIEEQRIAAGGC